MPRGRSASGQIDSDRIAISPAVLQDQIADAPVRWVKLCSVNHCQRTANGRPYGGDGCWSSQRRPFQVVAACTGGHIGPPLRRDGAAAPSCPLSGGCRPQGGWGLLPCQSGPDQQDVPQRCNPHRFSEPPGRGHKGLVALRRGTRPRTQHWRGSALGSPTIGELLSDSEAERCQAADLLRSRSQRTPCRPRL